MSSFTRYPRNTGGFSLDEAARAIQKSLSDLPALCPTCAAPLQKVVGEEHAERVWLLRCTECGRGLAYRNPNVPPRSRPPAG